MEILLAKVCSHDLEQYKHDMQESIQKDMRTLTEKRKAWFFLKKTLTVH